MITTLPLGLVSEKLAADFLVKKGYQVVETNFRKKWGEIDIVARKEGILIFAEVKASGKRIVGFEPELRATPEKMRKVQRTARTYMAYKKITPDSPWQLDILAVTFDKERGTANIKHFKNVSV